MSVRINHALKQYLTDALGTPSGRNQLKNDMMGGLMAAVVSLPLALAFGITSGAGPLAGLYSAVFVGFFAAVFGSTKTLISSATAPMTVVMTAILSQYAHNPSLAFTVVILGGVIQIALGQLKIGSYVDYVPFSVVSGFMSAVGMIIIILQIPVLTGYAGSAKGAFNILLSLWEYLRNLHINELLIGMIAFAIACLIPNKLKKIVPSFLWALLLGSLIALISVRMGWIAPVRQIGNIPTAIPMPYWPTFASGLLPFLLKDAITLAVLGSIDALLTSLIANKMTHSHYDADRELTGQGIGNIVSGLFHGLPGAGATINTVINIRSGGRSILSGISCAVILLVVLLGGGSIMEQIPVAVLAGILVKAGIDVMDWSYIRRIHKAPKPEIVIMLTVLCTTLLVDLTTGVAMGMIVAGFISARSMSRQQIANMHILSDAYEEQDLSPEAQALLQKGTGKVVYFHLRGSFTFCAAMEMLRRLSSHQILKYRVVVIDLADVELIDTSIGVIIEDLIIESLEAKKQVCIISRDQDTLGALKKFGVFNKIQDHCVFSDRITGLQAAINMAQCNIAQRT